MKRRKAMVKQKANGLAILALLLALFLTVPVHADLQHIIQGQFPFRDVPEGAWYYQDVKTAYQNNLIDGKSETQYAPDDNMTAAEAVKLASRMDKLLKDEGLNFVEGNPWYQTYVDYAKAKGLITSDLDWNNAINRAGYMEIFAKLITDAEATRISVPDGSIPDIPMTHPNAQAIYKLYRAGIVQGVDAAKNCRPETYIKRSEVATILTRMMYEKYRLNP